MTATMIGKTAVVLIFAKSPPDLSETEMLSTAIHEAFGLSLESHYGTLVQRTA
jgi:hypothetical protein